MKRDNFFLWLLTLFWASNVITLTLCLSIFCRPRYSGISSDTVLSTASKQRSRQSASIMLETTDLWPQGHQSLSDGPHHCYKDRDTNLLHLLMWFWSGTEHHNTSLLLRIPLCLHWCMVAGKQNLSPLLRICSSKWSVSPYRKACRRIMTRRKMRRKMKRRMKSRRNRMMILTRKKEDDKEEGKDEDEKGD